MTSWNLYVIIYCVTKYKFTCALVGCAPPWNSIVPYASVGCGRVCLLGSHKSPGEPCSIPGIIGCVCRAWPQQHLCQHKEYRKLDFFSFRVIHFYWIWTSTNCELNKLRKFAKKFIYLFSFISKVKRFCTTECV